MCVCVCLCARACVYVHVRVCVCLLKNRRIIERAMSQQCKDAAFVNKIRLHLKVNYIFN